MKIVSDYYFHNDFNTEKNVEKIAHSQLLLDE